MDYPSVAGQAEDSRNYVSQLNTGLGQQSFLRQDTTSPSPPLLVHMDKSCAELEGRLSELQSKLYALHERIFGGPLNPPSDAKIAREPASAEESIRVRLMRAMDYLSRAESFTEQLSGRL